MVLGAQKFQIKAAQLSCLVKIPFLHRQYLLVVPLHEARVQLTLREHPYKDIYLRYADFILMT